MVYMVHIIILLSFGFTGTSSTNIIETFLKVEFYDHLLTCDSDLINDEFNFEILDISNKYLGVGQVGFWSSQAKSSIFENQNFKFKYLSSQILAKSSQVKY